MQPRGIASQGAPRAGVPAPLFYGLVGLLMLTNALSAVAFVMSADIARLFGDRNEQVIAAYQDRITHLRIEVDRLHSRSFAQAGDLNLQLQELSAQQELLSEQHQIVRALVGKASALGIEAAALPAPPTLEVSEARVPTGQSGIDATARAVGAMMEETRVAMTAISSAAADRTEAIVLEFGRIGIPLDLPSGEMAGMGGPLLPPVGDETVSELIEDANAVLDALQRFQAARGAVERAPVHMPIAGNFRQSSGFGNRRDPFSGSRAFHSGLDFAAPTGTMVTSAGAGRVSFAGTKSGYGKTVEITHDNGLMTRYAHLSSILTETGQRVEAGTLIARVGSTGRSTGPHLHFEVRKGGGALDPKAFLDAGKRLLAMM